MKLNKSLLSLSILIVFVTMLIMKNVQVHAATANPPLYLGITELMEGGMGFTIGTFSGENEEGQSNEDSFAQIWNIVKYSDSSYADPTESPIYCLKAKVGFSDGSRTQAYNVYYDMKTEQTDIANENPILSGIVNGGHYNEILELLNLMYVKGQGDENYKENLLEAAEITTAGNGNDLTDDEIKAVQQAALWYFTNPENNHSNGLYDNRENTAWLGYTNSSMLSAANINDKYDSLNNYNSTQNAQANKLYKYLIKKAGDNASTSSTSTSTADCPVKVNNTVLEYDDSTKEGYYIIGPIKVEKTRDIPFSIDLNAKKGNGETITDFEFTNSSGVELPDDTLKKLIGKNFWLTIQKSSINEEDLNNLNINITGSYNETTSTLWGASTNNSAQPVVIPKKEKKPIEITLGTNVVEEKEFDLALRKYITKINGENVANTRVPNIDALKLNTKNDDDELITTATYKHRKDPVIVEKNDIVTYKITIYNEGEKAGRATQIVDQLPAGLEFQSVVSGNFELESYDKTTDNKLILKRKSSNTTNLAAYTTGTPQSETIEITCKVVATPNVSTQKVLTNVAWISSAIDEDSKTIDRDSSTSSSPSVAAGGLVTQNNGYSGNNSNKENLADDTFYYKGEQDDDDFEKIILLPESFDLKLVKCITQVNGTNVTERIKTVDASKLNTIVGGQLVTTANYVLDKRPVIVRKGDIVTYTLRVYNEGTIDGYASEISEDIPEGLEFLWSEKTGTELQNDTTLTTDEKSAIEFNQSRYWMYADTTLKKIKTNYLAKTNETTSNGNLLTAFGRNDGTKTAANLSYKEVAVKLKVVSEAPAGTIIRNEAAITDDSDKDGNAINPDRDSQPENWVGKDDHSNYQDDEDYDNIVLDEMKQFDLSLRKFIIAVSKDTTIENSDYLKNTDSSFIRGPRVDASKLNTINSDNELITTAEYNHTKEPVIVEKGDYVVYMIRVYNEGDIDGYAAEVKDHLPPYLEFVEGEFNNVYGWSKIDDRTVKTEYLSDRKITKPAKNGDESTVLNYREVAIMCRVKDTAIENQKITNIADITKYLDEDRQPVTDRDSFENDVELPSDSNLPLYKDDETGSYIPGQQDDDDFEKVIIMPVPEEEFDLKLIKRIVEVNEEKIPERIQNIDVSKLNRTRSSTGKLSETTAKYTLNKEPVKVKKGDIVTYTFRVYNEGTMDGYASEITEDIPEGLEFIWADDTTNLSDEEKAAVEFNENFLWGKFEYDGEKIVQISTDYLSKNKETTANGNLIKAFGVNNGTKTIDDLSYKEVSVKMKVVAEDIDESIIRNEAAITEDTDKDGNSVDDRDSRTDQWVKYEDDEDYDRIVLQPPFDLALRKFIIAISDDTTIEDSEYLKDDEKYTREPIVDTSKLNTTDKDGKIIITASYTHTKEPILVKKNDIVVYMLRVYNECGRDGYAAEIKDHLPPYLEFVEGDFNTKYGWDVSKDGRTVTTEYLKNQLIKKTKLDEDGKIVLDSKEVPIMCKVKDTAKTNENITNIADITKYLDEDKKEVKDRDSEENNIKLPEDKDLPGYNKSQEDDDDFEKIIVKEFDLALRKWVTQSIVIENGKQSTKNTGHKPYDDPEQIVKVELNRKKLDQVTVKFKYSIRVINEGDLEGYAKEITDYIPQGLKFVAADNPGWKDEGNNVISTKLLENKLLKPGEYADIEVVLTWINGQDNMGLKVNTAEISEDYNKYKVPDKDSTPDNKKPGEDDIDDAPVMLSITTGQVRIFFTLGFGILFTIAGIIIGIRGKFFRD